MSNVAQAGSIDLLQRLNESKKQLVEMQKLLKEYMVIFESHITKGEHEAAADVKELFIKPTVDSIKLFQTEIATLDQQIAAAASPSMNIVNESHGFIEDETWDLWRSNVKQPYGVGDVIQIGKQSILGIKKPIYVRQCYIDLANIIIPVITNVSVQSEFYLTGSPGIGKTTFTHYLLYLLLVDPRLSGFRMVLHTGPTMIMCDASGLREISGVPYDEYTIYVVDGKTKHASNMHALLWTCSPRNESFHEAWGKTNQPAYRFCMPTWSLDELLDCGNKTNSNVSAAEIEQLYLKCGGVARYVLDLGDGALEAALRSSEDVSAAIRQVEFTATSSKVTGVMSHRLFLVRANCEMDHNNIDNAEFRRVTPELKDSYTLYKFHSVQVASQYVFEKLMMCAAGQLLTKFRQLMIPDHNMYFYEMYCHHLFCHKDGEYKRRLLVLGKSKKRQPLTSLKLNKMNARYFHTPQVPGPDDYCIPYKTNYAVIDSYCSVGMMQITISETHDVKLTHQEFKDVLKLGLRTFIFVVPSNVYDKFHINGNVVQSFARLDIDVYVMCVDFENVQ